MRFAFVADTPDWACHRQGMGLVKYGTTEEHEWSLFHVKPQDFAPHHLARFDVIRVASAPLFIEMVEREMIPDGPHVICSLASFQDALRMRRSLRTHHKVLDAFAIVDHRLVAACAGYGKPILPYIDRTDPEVFYPLPPKASGKRLRAGWAGSIAAWDDIKHVDTIIEACEKAGVEFVRQDRELDGTKNEAEMREWFSTLDLYLACNDEETPTPVSQLEAASCGISIVTTRCGILWPLLPPWAVVNRPGRVEDMADVLRCAVSLGREELHRRALDFADRFSYFLHWNHDVAENHTADVAALRRGTP